MSVVRVIYLTLFLGNRNTYTNSVWFFQIIGHDTLLAYDFLMISITLDRLAIPLAMSTISIRYHNSESYNYIGMLLDNWPKLLTAVILAR